MSILENLREGGFDTSYVDDTTVYVQCSQCEAVVVNGTPCHEYGCVNLESEVEYV